MVTDDYLNATSFTDAAWESLYGTVDDEYFADKDASLIYNALEKQLRFIPFGEYLKRYIYRKAELTEPFEEVSVRTYQEIIRDSFADRHTPCSFTPTTAKLSALSKNWLTQQSVKRQVVFLLGFGLNMELQEVHEFLTKALREQGIDAKDPFEVICWYCYTRKYNYLKFEKLWRVYQNTPPNSVDMQLLYSEQTVNVRNTMYSVQDDATLMAYVSKLKTEDNRARKSVTTTARFEQLYAQAKAVAAEMFTESEDKVYTAEQITESDIEHVLYAAVPVDRHGNLTPGSRSKLSRQFSGKRLSRQHINGILSGNAEADRFDLITLNFFIYSQKKELEFRAKKRYTEFIESTNGILEDCYMERLYVANPYECFILMCILSEDPLGTYADVWELSYQQ